MSNTICPIIPHGLFRVMAKEGRGSVNVQYGAHIGTLTEFDYWCKDYEPPFRQLPTIEEYKAAQEKSAIGRDDPKSSSSGMDWTELLSQLAEARRRVAEARDGLASGERSAAWHERVGSDDALLVGANIQCFEERLRLRIAERDQLEAFLRNSYTQLLADLTMLLAPLKAVLATFPPHVAGTEQTRDELEHTRRLFDSTAELLAEFKVTLAAFSPPPLPPPAPPAPPPLPPQSPAPYLRGDEWARQSWLARIATLVRRIGR